MDFRTRRQLAVILVLLAMAAAVFFLLYTKFAPAPTCFDSRRNQNEEEADCGGPCIPCAFRHRQDIQIFWARFVTSRQDTYDVAAQIRNPNVKLGAPSFEYIFKLFDTAGIEVVSRRGTSFIYPGETIHLAEVGLRSARVIRSATLSVENIRWVLTDRIALDIIAGNREYRIDQEGGERGVVAARISNRTISDILGITVGALVFDSDGNLLGVHRTVLDRIGTGETRPVTFIWPTIFSRPVASIIIEARSPLVLPSGAP